MSRNYNVFLSWSGERSRSVAEYLRGWIAAVVQAAKPWMSDTEIDKGSRSLGEISKALSDIKVGIVCLTAENLNKPWLFFEAGALSKAIDERTRLCTYLIGGLKPSDVSPPLGMFQGTMATKEDTFKLVQTINQVLSDDAIPEATLENIFEAMWPKLELHLVSLPVVAADTMPGHRPPDEILAEVLELLRAQASYREKTQFLDAYIPTFQQFLPLLQQLVLNATRSSISRHYSGIPRSVPIDRTANDGFANTFGFPKDLQESAVSTPGQVRRYDLVAMSATSSSVLGREVRQMVQLLFTLHGLRPGTDTPVTYNIDFLFETNTARSVAAMLEQIADEVKPR